MRLSYDQLVRPEKKKPGRPKAVPKGKPYALHASAALLGTSRRPRCVNRKCKKRLKANQLLVCSEYCREEAAIFFRKLLTLLKKAPLKVPPKPKDVPNVPIYDASRAVQGLEADEGGGKAVRRRGRKPKVAKARLGEGLDRGRQVFLDIVGQKGSRSSEDVGGAGKDGAAPEESQVGRRDSDGT